MIALTVWVACGWMGCATLQLERPVRIQQSGIQQSDRNLQVPLEQVWRYNGESGFGEAVAFAEGGYLFLGNRIGEVHVVDLETGRQKGKVDLGNAIAGRPALVDDRLLIVPLEKGRYGLVAYDLLTGEPRWRLKGSGVAAGLLLVQDSLLAVADLDGTVRALDPRTGAEQWTSTPDSLARIYAAPVETEQGHIVVADDEGRITALHPKSGEVAWVQRLETPVLATPVAARDFLYVSNTRGEVVALDAETGVRRWEYAFEGATVRVTSPVVSGDALYVGASDGTVRKLDLDTGATLWTAQFDSNVSAPPHVVGDLVFIGTLGEEVAALDSETGSLRWKTELKGRVKTALVSAGDRLVVLAEPKDVYAFAAAR